LTVSQDRPYAADGCSEGDSGLNLAPHIPRVARTGATALALFAVLGAAVSVSTVAAESAESAQYVATALVDWLVDARPSLPDGLLASQGTIRFQLRRLGSARGSLGAAQSRAVLAELRGRAGRGSGVILAVDGGDAGLALVRARLTPPSAAGSVDILITIRLEDGRWRLRELREASR
jgi:hypothetical protein